MPETARAATPSVSHDSARRENEGVEARPRRRVGGRAKERLESNATPSTIASRTSRVTLGTSALILPLRKTVRFATTGRRSTRTLPTSVLALEARSSAARSYVVEFEVAGVLCHHRDDVIDEQILLLRHRRTRPAEPYRREFHASRTAGYWHPRGAVLRASSANSAEVERRQREDPGGRDHLVDEDVAPVGSSLLEAGGRPIVDARNAGPPQPARIPGRVRER